MKKKDKNLRANGSIRRVRMAGPKLALERIGALRTALLKEPIVLRKWVDVPAEIGKACGMPACFGGHIILMFGPIGTRVKPFSNDFHMAKVASRLIGVDLKSADYFDLFSGGDYGDEREEALRRADIAEALVRGRLIGQ